MNNIIPNNLAHEIQTALSFFPQLDAVKIDFVVKDNMNGVTMKAQPTVMSFFKKRKNRAYKIFISRAFKQTKTSIPITTLPFEVLVGWIGHELGHIVDYEQMSHMELLKFAWNYVLFDEHYNESEYSADFYAVRQGMEQYLIKKKQFVLHHPDINDAYKRKFRTHYLSPDDIIHLVKGRDA